MLKNHHDVCVSAGPSFSLLRLFLKLGMVIDL